MSDGPGDHGCGRPRSGPRGLPREGEGADRVHRRPGGNRPRGRPDRPARGGRVRLPGVGSEWWVPPNVPGVFSVRDGSGRAFLAWQLSGGGFVLGMAGEINLAVWAEASVSVFVPKRSSLSLQ